MKNKKILLFVIIGIIVVILGFSMIYIVSKHNRTDEKIEKANIDGIKIVALRDDITDVEAVKIIKDNIVKIKNKINDEEIIGTGFFDISGYLVTNSHIVDVKGDITVEYNDGTVENATLIANDIISDVAILEVNNKKAFAMKYENTINLNVTDEVYALGFPLNLEGEATVTKGIVSARRSRGGIEYIQTDASITNGSSGGPLITKKGTLVGMNSLATDKIDIGISISSESIQNIIYRLINDKNITYIDGEREGNALSAVLVEIGYKTDDLYEEKHLWNQKEKEENNENESESESNKIDDYPHVENKVEKENYIYELETLSIDGYNISFSKYNYQYEIVVDQSVNSLKINAIPEDNRCVVKIFGNENFKDGNNNVEIHVIDKNGTRKSYIINVIKKVTKLDEAVGIISGLDLQKNTATGVNSFYMFWDYVDSDGIRINKDGPIDIIDSIKVSIYTGMKNIDDELSTENSRLLKTYTFTPTLDMKSIYIPISDIRNLLVEDDYKGGIYGDVDLTFYITINTNNQRTFKSKNYWGLNKQ